MPDFLAIYKIKGSPIIKILYCIFLLFFVGVGDQSEMKAAISFKKGPITQWLSWVNNDVIGMLHI